MTATDLAAACATLLGSREEPVAVVAPHAPAIARALTTQLSVTADATAAAIIVWLDGPADADARRQVLQRLHAQLAAGATLLVVDHSQPVQWWARANADLRLLFCGLWPSRARYLTAREVAAAGFAVTALRLHAQGAVQLIRAVRC